MESILDSAQQAYDEYEEGQLTHGDAVQYSSFRSILQDEGKNHHKIPHSQIQKAQEHGRPAADYLVDQDVVLNARNALNELLML